MAKPKYRCVNWTPDKGHPLDYEISNIEHVWPEIKFAGPLAKPGGRYWQGDEDAQNRAIQEIQKPKTGKQINDMYFGDPKHLHMELWTPIKSLLNVSPE